MKRCRAFGPPRPCPDAVSAKAPRVSERSGPTRPEPPGTSKPAEPKKPILERKGPLSDQDGLDRAYADPSGLYLDPAGTLFVAGTRGSLLSGEWRENYLTMGVPLIQRALGTGAEYRVEENARYERLQQFMRDHGDQVKNLVGHSKGSAVIDTWKKNHPQFKGQARLFSTPFEDPLGREALKDAANKYKEVRGVQRQMQTYRNRAEEWLEDTAVDKISSLLGLDKVQGMRERGTERIANEGDFAAFLDASATRTQHTNPFAHLAGGGPHDYHDGIAQYKAGFAKDGVRPGGFDPSYRTFPPSRQGEGLHTQGLRSTLSGPQPTETQSKPGAEGTRNPDGSVSITE